jgi:hypothetical protein
LVASVTMLVPLGAHKEVKPLPWGVWSVPDDARNMPGVSRPIHPRPCFRNARRSA